MATNTSFDNRFSRSAFRGDRLEQKLSVLARNENDAKATVEEMYDDVIIYEISPSNNKQKNVLNG